MDGGDDGEFDVTYVTLNTSMDELNTTEWEYVTVNISIFEMEYEVEKSYLYNATDNHTLVDHIGDLVTDGLNSPDSANDTYVSTLEGSDQESLEADSMVETDGTPAECPIDDIMRNTTNVRSRLREFVPFDVDVSEPVIYLPPAAPPSSPPPPP